LAKAKKCGIALLRHPKVTITAFRAADCR